ncbi:MAG: NeuD/PglB/VioB family sugar acetyltransferase [Candidatus Caldatribacteriaceae bacterium]
MNYLIYGTGGHAKGVRLVIAIGENRARKEVAERFKSLGVEYAVVVHPDACLGRNVEIGEGMVVVAGAVINADTFIRRHVIVNTAATVDHGCLIEDFVHLAPGSHLAGGITIGSETLVGVGACVIPKAHIGKQAIIGTGAVVIHDLPDRITAVGVPARIIKL